MKKTLALGIGAVVLSGCALPVPFQVASWALDGISYLATEKSMTDHGLSMVVEQDCALLRGLTEGNVCKDWNDSGVLVADANTSAPESPVIATTPTRIGFANGMQSDIPPLNTEIDQGAMPNVEALANFDTAAGPSEDMVTPEVSVTRPLESVMAPVRAATVTKKSMPVTELVSVKLPAKPIAKLPLSLPVTATAELPRSPIPQITVPTAFRLAAATTNEPVAGIYYVIGSFRNYGNAQTFAGHHEGLVPEVLAAKLDGAPVYRVVVGPVSAGKERSVYRRVARAGLRDSWAIRVVPGDWQLAHKVIKRQQQFGIGRELAKATR
jgi:hypothetical protein